MGIKEGTLFRVLGGDNCIYFAGDEYELYDIVCRLSCKGHSYKIEVIKVKNERNGNLGQD